MRLVYAPCSSILTLPSFAICSVVVIAESASLDYFGAQAKVKGSFDATASSAPLDFAGVSVPNSEVNYVLCEGVNFAYLVSGLSPEEPSQAGVAVGDVEELGNLVEFAAPAADARTSIQTSAAAWPAPEIERFMTAP